MPERTINRAAFWLVLWTTNNVGVTILNKSALSKVDFKYPYFLSALHMLCNTIGCEMVFTSLSKSQSAASKPALHINPGDALLGSITRKDLDRKGKLVMFGFSFIFSLNIAIGNVSLRHVSVNFNQVMRSLVPALTIAMGLMLNKQISKARQYAVVPVVAGVAMACYGDISYTPLGFCYTCFCVILSAVKVVASGEMLTGAYTLHPVDLLSHMAPLAMVQCLAVSIATGEMNEIIERWHDEFNPITSPSPQPFLVVMFGAVASFSMNICSLMANKLTSPLTLCIASNVKQVLVITFGTLLFGDVIQFWNGLGIIVVFVGSARYSCISVLEKTANVDTDAVDPSQLDEEQGALQDGADLGASTETRWNSSMQKSQEVDNIEVEDVALLPRN